MASTWSALKVELLETGANSGTWGTLTNVNLGDAVLGEAITGSATVDFATDADVTITLTDAATTQSARNLRLNITESSTGVGSVRNLILGSGCQIEKFYLINNTGTGAKTVKNTSGTGISVPAGKATLVYNNGTNVVDAASYFTSLTLGSALPVASGGTGLTTGTSGGVLAYTASGTLASSGALTQYGVVYGGGAGAVPVATAAGTTGQVLTATTSGAPSWASPATSGTVTSVAQTFTGGIVSVAGSPITASGTLALTVAGTSGGIPYFSSGTTWATSTALAANALVLGGGAGAAPSTTTTGTGVVTALGVNTGSSGAFVVNGGALGTPSSGTVTNLTGTASININGTVGATSTNTGAFTTLAATALTATLDSTFSSTGALIISKGTTGQRPTPASGMLRFNTTTTEFEGYNGAAWASVGGAALSNDTTTATNVYPLFANATTGTASTLFTGNANLLYKPSTGDLSAIAHISSNGITLNANTIATSYTIAATNNGLSAGPVSINGGVTITVSTGSVWTVV